MEFKRCIRYKARIIAYFTDIVVKYALKWCLASIASLQGNEVGVASDIRQALSEFMGFTEVSVGRF